ncbi:hypothetical protein HKX48_005771 [Thoreauomyces humboldtii]|nr:hypothetical protein HKX48_005771 [Thoreauomyces humboldtii]
MTATANNARSLGALPVSSNASNQTAADVPARVPVTPELLLANNKEWAAEMDRERPGFLGLLAQQQAPEVLWIGCSDSRVPANELLKLLPGEVFVHRNIANIIHHADLNAHSVLQYAVDVLKIKHVIVCGHYGCGGVAAALTNNQYGLIDNWIRIVKDISIRNERELSGLNAADKCDRLVELNVGNSVDSIAHSTVVQNAWARGQQLAIYGWCYRLTDGILKDLGIKVDSAESLRGVHRMDSSDNL